MPNVTFNNIVSSSDGAGNFDATAISTNFNNVSATAATFDNANYSNSAMASSNISSAAILSQHLGSNDMVHSNHIAAGAIVNTHLNFQSSDSGVQALQCGPSPPAGGVAIARYAVEFPVVITGDPYTASLAVNWSSAVDGDPNFTDAPVFLAEPLADPAGLGSTRGHFWIVATVINSVSCAIHASWRPATITETETYHFQVAGGV